MPNPPHPRNPLKHLIVCREHPPAPYPAGGIGAYTRHIAQLLANAGETVHVLAQRWEGAPQPLVVSHAGRLSVHRVSLEEPVWPAQASSEERALLCALAQSNCPAQVFAWQAARFAERLIEQESIDVVEAQEWEAPLHYLQLRRGLGLGPQRQPPIIVHLHSPSAMIFEHNDWDKSFVDYLPLTQLEEFTIRAADSLICPSAYLARGVTQRFGLSPSCVTVVRYPMGETPLLPRTPQTWARDAICYVGRLELRKGVVEWVDAAVKIAATQLGVTFHFFGSDTSLDGGSSGESVLAYLKRRIPRAVRRQFHFHGPQSREQLLLQLSEFSIAVVPSRWENLPYTCIEAMATGLPVLVSPHGGMAELIVDGESGWVAREGSPAGLAEALTRALAATPTERAVMGARASQAVRQVCANDVVVSRHLEHRSEVVLAGAHQLATPTQSRDHSGPRGLGFVITCAEAPQRLASTVASVRAQTQPAPCVVVLAAALHDRAGAAVQGVDQVIYMENFSPSAAANRGLAALLALQPDLCAVALLDQTMRPMIAFAERCEMAFASQPSAAIVSPWVVRQGRRTRLDTDFVPLDSHLLQQQDLPFGCALRIAAMQAPASQKWASLMYPEALLSVDQPHRARKSPRRRYSGLALIQNRSAGFALQWFLAAPLREKARWISRIVLHPGRLLHWLAWQIRHHAPKRRLPPLVTDPDIT